MLPNVENESWWVEDGCDHIVLRSSSGTAATFGGRLCPNADRDRAVLAAAAPPMARLLLRLHARHGRCIWCGETLGDAHACELTDVLRRAGVIR